MTVVIYGFYKANMLGVTAEDILIKSADKISPKAPTVANLIRKISQETDDSRMFHGLELSTWSGKGASNSSQSLVVNNSLEQNSALKFVTNTKELLRALQAAKQGRTIVLRPGKYKIKQRKIKIGNSGSEVAPIIVKAENLGEVDIELDSLDGFYIDKPYWIFENLRIKGTCVKDSRCEHAFHVVGKGSNAIIRNNIVTDFNAAVKVNGIKYGKTSHYPDFGRVENNTFYNNAVRDTDNPVATLDILAVSDWIVRDNFIADFVKGRGNKISYAGFFKGNGSRNVFERNLIICRLNLKSKGGGQVGLSFGGGGTGKASCRHQQCEVENSSGIIRHNLIMNCNDVAVYLNKSKDTEIYNNTLINTLGIDVRFSQSNAVIANNLLTGRIKNRNAGSSKKINNIVISLSDIEDYYRNPVDGDFSVANGDEMINQGVNLQALEKDFCGKSRGPLAVDIGAFEYTEANSVCNPFQM